MGEARRNQASSQFIGRLPEAVFSAASEVNVEPSRAWQAAHPVVEGEAQVMPGEQDVEVVIRVSAIYSVPMHTIPQAQWPGALVPAGVIRLPLLALKRTAKQLLEKEQPLVAAMIKLPGDPDFNQPSVLYEGAADGQ